MEPCQTAAIAGAPMGEGSEDCDEASARAALNGASKTPASTCQCQRKGSLVATCPHMATSLPPAPSQAAGNYQPPPATGKPGRTVWWG